MQFRSYRSWWRQRPGERTQHGLRLTLMVFILHVAALPLISAGFFERGSLSTRVTMLTAWHGE